jgi:uncharacterized protein (DUF1684 family)
MGPGHSRTRTPARLRRPSSCGWAVILTIALSPAIVGQFSEYHATQDAWRADREARLVADDGWLTVAALYFLRPGENSFGASPLSDMVLPEGPASAGVFELRGDEVYLRATDGKPLIVDGQSVTAAQLYPDEGHRKDLTVGDLTMWVHKSGERLAIRLRDKNSQIRRDFTGLKWFPVDERYRVQGRFIRHDEPIAVGLPNILGDIEQFTSHGSVVLTLNGEQMKMLPVASESGDRLWFIFRDLTSGSETYPAARFLYADLPDDDGWTTLDFNQAYNPPCAFNPHTTCPLPPKPNRLGVRVEAGEKNYH